MIVVTVARKPLSESTIVGNVIEHGTGGLNIDGCRVGGGDARKIDNYQSTGPQGCIARPGDAGHAGRAYETRFTTAGRWPANLILGHLDGCKQEGCAAGCPVAHLDAQSGESRSASGPVSYKRSETSGWIERGGSYTPGREWDAIGYGDMGGASRYFKQVGGRK